MSEWESICCARASDATGPAFANESHPHQLHLYVVSGVAEGRDHTNTSFSRVFPQQGQITTINCVPDPSWAGKSRLSAIGCVAAIRTPNRSGKIGATYLQDEPEVSLGDRDTIALPAGAVELRLCTTAARNAGVFARVSMQSRGVAQDLNVKYYNLERMSFVKIRDKILTYYDLKLEYGVIGEQANVELLSYYYPSVVLPVFNSRSSNDQYDTPFELAVFQPTSSHLPVAVVRDPTTREGFCRVFSCPSFCETAGDPFVRTFGQLILDGTVGDQELYLPALGQELVDNCFGAIRTYMRSAAYNVGESARNPTGPHWITRPPITAKPGNNASFSYDYSGDGAEESFPAYWSRNYVGDHNRTRLTLGVAGITATPTASKIPAIAGDAEFLRLSFHGVPPTPDLLSLDYRYWNPLYGEMFTLEASETTQNCFFGEGSRRVLYEPTAIPSAGLIQQPSSLFWQSTVFPTEEEAIAAMEGLEQFVVQKKAAIESAGAGTSIEDLNTLQVFTDNPILIANPNHWSVEFVNNVVIDSWRAEAGLISAGYNALSTQTITDESDVSENDHFRFHSPALDVRKNAAESSGLDSLLYTKARDYMAGNAHFSLQVSREVLGVVFSYFTYSVLAAVNGFVLRATESNSWVHIYDSSNLPVDFRATVHKACSFGGFSDQADSRVINYIDTISNNRIAKVEFLP